MERLRVRLDWWNGLVRGWFARRLRSVVVNEGPGWAHPWFSRLGWDAGLERWRVAVAPGLCVTPRLGEAEVRVPGGERLETGGDFVGADAAGLPWRLTEDRVSLAIAPGLWRAVGTDAAVAFGEEGAEAVPEFFRNAGVLEPGTVTIDPTGGIRTSEIGNGADRSKARLLRAVDLMLYVDRPAARLDWTVGGGVTGTFLQGAVTIGTAPGARDYPWLALRKAAAGEEDLAIDSAEVLALGGLMQSGRDGLRIATLYLLSSPGMKDGSEVDGVRWMPFVRHHVWWNVAHHTVISLGDAAPTPLQVPAPGLGAGTLGAIGNAVLAASNDNLGLLSALIGQARVKGRFFTV